MYYSLRITPAAFNCDFEIALRVVQHIINECSIDEECYITADEKIDKFGNEIARHFHFNFIADTIKDTLQRKIRKWFAAQDFVCKGNKCYSLTECDEPEDMKRWLRYCMKEKYLVKLTQLPYPIEEIREMEMMAKDERERCQKLNRDKQQEIVTGKL